MTNSTDILML